MSASVAIDLCNINNEDFEFIYNDIKEIVKYSEF